MSSNASATQTIAIPGVAGSSGTLTLPAGTQTQTGTTLQVTLQTLPSGIVALQSAQRRSSDVGTANAQLYLVLQPSQTITLPAFPSFTFVVPPSLVLPNESEFLAFYDAAQSGWRTLFGPVIANGGVVTFTGSSAPLTLVAGQTYVFALYGIPAAGNPVPSPSSVGFNLTGQTQIVTVTESNYSGSFTATSSNPSVVSAAAVSGSSFVLTAGTSAGSATIVVRDSAGRSSLVDAGVTLTFGTVR